MPVRRGERDPVARLQAALERLSEDNKTFMLARLKLLVKDVIIIEHIKGKLTKSQLRPQFLIRRLL